MANAELQVRPRTVLGKKVKAMRRGGVTPANVFGHQLESRAVEASTADLTHTLRGMSRNAILDLKVEGEEAPRTVVVRAVSRNPVTSQILHVDFYQIKMTEKMRADVSIVLVGTSDAVTTFGGVLLQTLESIAVEALPGDIPEQFEVDVSRITELEQSLHVRDLHIDQTKVTLHTDEDVVVARVAAPRLAAAEEEAAPAEGEVPGEGEAPAEGGAPAAGEEPAGA